jgi:hypothetical protein
MAKCQERFSHQGNSRMSLLGNLNDGMAAVRELDNGGNLALLLRNSDQGETLAVKWMPWLRYEDKFPWFPRAPCIIYRFLTRWDICQ